MTRVVDRSGRISFGRFGYHAERSLALQPLDAVERLHGGQVELHHNGVPIATHVRCYPPEKSPLVMRRRGPPLYAQGVGRCQ